MNGVIGGGEVSAEDEHRVDGIGGGDFEPCKIFNSLCFIHAITIIFCSLKPKRGDGVQAWGKCRWVEAMGKGDERAREETS